MAVDMFAARERARGEDGGRRTAALRLLDAVPAMREAIPPAERDRARTVVLAPMYTSEPGPMTLPSPTGPAHPFTVVIVRGMVLRETYLGDRSVCELLGTHDLIDTRPDDDGCLMPSRTEYVALEQTTFVVLDDRFATAARKWPGLHEVVGLQHARQARRASRHLATLGLSRVEDRVIALFCDLSDRWGRVTPLGIRIDVPLTHTVLGRLVGARRPTVTLALSALAADGLLRRDADGSWLLARDVPLAA